MQLDDALTQIAHIRERIVRSGTFRGYRSVPIALSGLLAFVAAAVQSVWIRRPDHFLDNYVLLWGSVAILSVLMSGGEMVLRLRRSGSVIQRDMSRTAVEQFTPCLVAGALLTFTVMNFDIAIARVLPGLWMILFSLGVFASRSMLPRAVSGIGFFYLLAGVVTLSHRLDPLNAWTMGLTFGFGQLGMALLLYWTLERNHERE